jgi:putative ABC transport system permease protein
MAEIRIGIPVLAFNLGLSLAAGLLLGFLPAIHASRRNLADELRSGARGTEGRRSGRARAALVVVEVGVAVVLLVGGGLMLRSLRRLQETDPGYRPDHLLSVQLSLPKQRYSSAATIDRYREALTARLAALPGVTAVGAASLNPLTTWKASVSYTIDGRAEPAVDRAPLANYRAAGPGYFAALGMPLLEGRAIEEGDRAETLPVAVISATLARRHFERSGALGARLFIDDTEGRRAVTVVGVAGDVKHTGLDADGTADVYVPYSQAPQQVAVWLANIFCVAVRTSDDPHRSMPGVRREIAALDPDVAASVRTMEEALDASLEERRFNTALLELFGVVALLLALAGVYAMSAIGVSERRREIGVRLSVGAGRGHILGLVVGRALAPVAAGILLGAAAALALTRLVSGLLFGIAPHDAPTFLTVALALTAAALTASLLPAIRATRIDPVSVLRAE